MWTFWKSTVAAAITGLLLGGCTEVSDPITPEQARAEVIDAARDITAALHGEVAEALFRYESCNDQGEAPFRGVVQLILWEPGTPHTQAVDPQQVIQALTSHGWSTDSDFVSHSPTLRKGPINIIVDVTPPPPPGKTIGGHVGVDVNGQCRDTFDHRKDRSILSVDVSAEVTGG